MNLKFTRTWALLGSVALFASACGDDGIGLDARQRAEMSHGPGSSPGTDIRAPGDYDINGARWTALFPFGVGTGVIDPFLTLQNNGSQHAFNTDASPLPLDAKRPNFTDALPLNNVPVILEDGGTWREFILDANESSSGTGPQFSIDVFDVWVCNDPNARTYSTLSQFQSNPLCTKVYDIGGHGALLATSANSSGSGNDLDYRILIPASVFGSDANDACQYNPTAPDCGYYIILYTHMGGVGGAYATDATFEEFSTIRRGFITVTKTANTSLTRTTTRTWTWTIAKEILDPSSPALILPSQSLDIDYKVTLNASSNDVVVDSDWAVSGDIVIANPSSNAVSIASVADVISHASLPDINVSVSCPGVFPQPLAAGGTLTCTYTQALPNGDPRTNQAHVTLADLASVASPSVAVDFNSATVNAVLVELDKCVDLDDLVEINGGPVALGVASGAAPSGTYCANQGLPKVFTYTRTVTPDELECGENTVDNTATFITDDSGTEGDASASLDIEVACVDGCTLTQGYWKTHADPSRKKFDETWLLLPGGVGTTFFLSNQTWPEVFNTPVAGNQYYALAHQYMAAVLNGLAGADQSAVSGAIDDATELFENWTPADVGALKGNNATRAQFVSLAATLAAYNEGLTGPGHCTEQN